jgi:hypothetical protein
MKNISCANCGHEISQKAPLCPKCGHPNKKANHLSGKQTLFYLAVGIAVIWYLASRESGSGHVDPKASAIASVELQKLSWHKGGFDNVMLLDVTFLNRGSHPVKDIELKCEHFSNSGTRIDSNSRVIYEVVSPGKSKTVKDFNMGLINTQAASSECKITNLVPM